MGHLAFIQTTFNIFPPVEDELVKCGQNFNLSTGWRGRKREKKPFGSFNPKRITIELVRETEGKKIKKKKNHKKETDYNQKSWIVALSKVGGGKDTKCQRQKTVLR